MKGNNGSLTRRMRRDSRSISKQSDSITKKRRSGRGLTNRKKVPALILGGIITKDMESMKEWKYKIVGSYGQTLMLHGYGINLTDALETSAVSRIAYADRQGYDPLFLVGGGWMEEGHDIQVAPVVYNCKSTVIDLSGAYTNMVPNISLTKILEWYRDSMAHLANEDISQKERVGRWMAGHGWCVVKGHHVQFGLDWDFLRGVMEDLKVDDIETELKTVRRLYEQSEDKG